MLRWVMVMATLATLWCLPSHAQYRQGDGGRAWAQQGEQRPPPGARPGQRQNETDRRDGDGNRRGSLTPDERRELERDLRRADREIYRKGRDKR